MSRSEREHLVEALEEIIATMRRGERLPSEQQLMRRFDAGRSQVRLALQELEDLHLVRRVPGVGTFVHERITYPISPRATPSFREMVAAAGARAETVLLDHARVRATSQLAQTLDVEPGTTVQHLRRLGHIDEQPACLFEEWFAPIGLPELDVAVRSFGSVGEVLRSVGFTPQRAAARGTVATASAAVCAWLEVPSPTQTWYVESTTVDRDSGRPLMHSRAWTRMDLVQMVFDVP